MLLVRVYCQVCLIDEMREAMVVLLKRKEEIEEDKR